MLQESAPAERPRLGRRDALVVAGLLVFTLALVASSLPRRELWHPDETRFAVVARTMSETGEYVIPHLGSERYQDKPPMLFWLMNLSAWLVGGFTGVAVRLPTVVAAAAAVVGLYLLGRLFFDLLSSLLAAVMMATSVLFLMTSQFAITDPVLIGLQTWALYCFLRGEYAPGRGWGWYAGFWVLTALATLTKGPVGLVVPGAVLGVWVLLRRGLYDLPRADLRRGVLKGILGYVVVLLILSSLYVAIVLAWLAPATLRAGWLYTKYLLMNQTLWRISGPRYSRHQPWHYYLWTFFLNFWPWAVFVPEALVRVARRWWRWRGSLERRVLGEGLLLVLVWFVVVMAGWSVAEVKRVRYVLFAYPAASLALGWMWSGLLRGRVRWSWATTAATVVLIAVLVVLAAAGTVVAVPGLSRWVAEHAPGDSSVPAADRAAALAAWRWGFAALVVTLVVLVVGLVRSLTRRRSWVWLWVLLMPIALQGHGVVWIFPMMNEFRCMRPVGEISRELRSRYPQATVLLWRLSWTATAWYAHTTDIRQVKTPKEVLAVLESKRQAFVLMEASQLERLQAREPRFRTYPRSERQANVRRIVILTNRPRSIPESPPPPPTTGGGETPSPQGAAAGQR